MKYLTELTQVPVSIAGETSSLVFQGSNPVRGRRGLSAESIGAGAHKLSFPSYTEMIQFKNLRINPAELLPGFHGAVFFSPPLKLYPL